MLQPVLARRKVEREDLALARITAELADPNVQYEIDHDIDVD
jgi:hypothetical protein